MGRELLRPLQIKLHARTLVIPREWAVSHLLYVLRRLRLGAPFALGALKRDTFPIFLPLGDWRRTLSGTPAPAGPTVDLTSRYRPFMDPFAKL